MGVAFYDQLTETLVHLGKLSEKERERLLRLYHESGKPLSDLLLEKKIVEEEELLRLLSDSLELPILRLEAYQIDREVIRLLPREWAERYAVLPIAKVGSILTLATPKPLDLVGFDDLKRLTGCEIRLVLVSRASIQNAMAAYYTQADALSQFLEEATPDQVEVVPTEGEERPIPVASVDEAPIVRMVNLIIEEAVRNRASDIHLEPYREEFRIRYRIDGILKESFHQSLEIYPAVISRIKILSSLDITEKRIPQDGRFKTDVSGREVDFRVSTLPTFFGEKAVLRLLDKQNIRAGLDQLGFSEMPIQIFNEAIQHPYGMILVTGPTGSGKSTTLYSVLNLLNTPERNLMTIEDPIEYQIEGVTQTQVKPEIDLTFANGLRSLLRQSPDVVLVGEIRDPETANIAVKAALTGHLVLSTLHTNGAAAAVTRLIDMGVEPFLISSSVILVAGQRLLRRICPYCKEISPVPVEVLKRLGLPPSEVKEIASFKGKGCRHCNGTGYFGRLGAIEVLGIDVEIRRAILARASSGEIEALARKKGMETLFENALGLFKTGKTTLEEVLRVTAME